MRRSHCRINGLGSLEIEKMVVRMSDMATSVYTLYSVKKKSMSADESWFQTYLTDTLGALNDFYARQVLDSSHTGVLRVP